MEATSCRICCTYVVVAGDYGKCSSLHLGFIQNALKTWSTSKISSPIMQRNILNLSYMMLLLGLAVVTVTPPLDTFWAADTLYCLPPLIVVILRLLLITVGPLTELGTGTRLICWLELSRVMLLWRPPTEPTRLPPTVRYQDQSRALALLTGHPFTHLLLALECKHLN